MILTLYSIDTHFDASATDSLENVVEKGEIAHIVQFLLVPQCFLLNQIIVPPFVHIVDIISLFVTELEEPKIGVSCKGLRLVCEYWFQEKNCRFETRSHPLAKGSAMCLHIIS